MVKSDLFYYIPYTTSALGYQCYWNQLKMIESSIELLFAEEGEWFNLWQEILEPLRKIIGDGEDKDNYPGGDYPGIFFQEFKKAYMNIVKKYMHIDDV